MSSHYCASNLCSSLRTCVYLSFCFFLDLNGGEFPHLFIPKAHVPGNQSVRTSSIYNSGDTHTSLAGCLQDQRAGVYAKLQGHRRPETQQPEYRNFHCGRCNHCEHPRCAIVWLKRRKVRAPRGGLQECLPTRLLHLLVASSRTCQ
jgi:hypothetical protein